MSESSYANERHRVHGLYRDRENGWLFGVCAGLADRFNLNVAGVRIVAVISLIVAFWATAVIYLAATVLIREKPLVYRGRQSEDEFWRACRGRWRSQ